MGAHSPCPRRSIRANVPLRTSRPEPGEQGKTQMEIIIQLIAGAVGGNAAGAAMKNLSLGTLGNSIAGIVGGGIGGQLLGMLGVGGADAAAGMDIGSLVQSVAGGGVGGAVLLAVVGAVKKAMGK